MSVCGISLSWSRSLEFCKKKLAPNEVQLDATVIINTNQNLVIRCVYITVTERDDSNKHLELSFLLWQLHIDNNKVTPLLAAPWIPCIFLNAFSSFCEPLQYFVGFLFLAHVKIPCIFQYFNLILWNLQCVFRFLFLKPQRQAVFLGSFFQRRCVNRQKQHGGQRKKVEKT